MGIIALGSFCIIAFCQSTIMAGSGKASQVWYEIAFVLLMCFATIAAEVFHYSLKKLAPFLDASARSQAMFLDMFNDKYADAAILFSAGLSLFLELGIIRWQSSILPFIAFYKNFSLLACFAGLGLGYALAARDRIPIVIVLPLLAWQFGLMTYIRYLPGINLRISPFREQITMGVAVGNVAQDLFLYGLLALVFLITALTFMPVGQVCGRLMERRTKLRAYGLNLLGSLLGVLLMLVASFLWTPPLVWFALCFLAVLLFTVRTPSLMIVGLSFSAVCTIALAWPVDPLTNRVYSPYQLLEISRSEDTGLTLISAAGHYYQRIFDFSGTQNTSLEFCSRIL